MEADKPREAALVDRAVSAFRWVAALRFLGQLVSWLSTIFVIRFLAPEDYGIISLTEVFRTFLVFFSTMGLGQGLMKVEELTNALVSKTLGILVLINTGLFAIQYLMAPYVAAFYDSPELELVLRVLAFTYFLIPWTSIPSSLIARELDHRKTSKVTFLSNVLASALSLTLAWLGFGYWALVAAMIFTMAFNCICFNFLLSYPRIPSFNLAGSGEVFRFGALVAIADLVYVAYTKLDVALAGKYFDVAEIGLYGVAIQLATMLMGKSIPLFNMVAFPAFARINAASGPSNEYLITTISFASALIFPLFLGVAMVGEELITLVLGSKWSQISLIFAILAVGVPFRIIAYIITPAILAADGARLDLSNALITLAFLAGAVLLLTPLGLEGVALAWSLASLCLFALATLRGGALLRIPPGDILGAMLPPFGISLAMCLVIYLAGAALPDMSSVYSLYRIPLGALVYALLFWFLFRARTGEFIRVTRRLVAR